MEKKLHYICQKLRHSMDHLVTNINLMRVKTITCIEIRNCACILLFVQAHFCKLFIFTCHKRIIYSSKQGFFKLQKINKYIYIYIMYS